MHYYKPVTHQPIKQQPNETAASAAVSSTAIHVNSKPNLAYIRGVVDSFLRVYENSGIFMKFSNFFEFFQALMEIPVGIFAYNFGVYENFLSRQPLEKEFDI